MAVVKNGTAVGKYELGRILGEGNFGKVKYAENVESGEAFAIKIIEKKRISDHKRSDQIRREISMMKMLKHPNVVRLHEILGSKTKIYMVLEYVAGGDLFERIESKGRFGETKGRKLFQQLIDGLSYCHEKGVYHRDIKLENILIDAKGDIKISDFGLGALPEHFQDDGLLHTTCGSPNYVAPEVLSYRGYEGGAADIWSCGVILYVLLTGFFPFDDRNLAVLYQKVAKGDTHIPKSLSLGAQNMIRRILDPNPNTRITMAEIKEDDWFNQDYIPSANPEEEEEEDDAHIEDHPFITTQKLQTNTEKSINAFQLIGMSPFLDLSGFFEKEDAFERKIRFTSNYCPKVLLKKIEDIVTEMGLTIEKRNGKQLKVVQEHKGQRIFVRLSFSAEMLLAHPSLYVVELKKSYGDSSLFRKLCSKLTNDLGVRHAQQPLRHETDGSQICEEI